MRIALCSLLACGLLPAQELKVWSEFQRIDPFGEVVAVDRVEHPREILSPAVARNAFVSFHVAVTVPENTPSFLYLQQNPEWLKITVYKEEFHQTPGGWIPDALTQVSAPCTIILPEPNPIPGQTTVVYWMDVWVPEQTPLGRMRLQAVLKSGELWIVYPMEMRVVDAVTPKIGRVAGELPPITARADAATKPVQTPGLPHVCVRQMIRRNAIQDRALASALKLQLPAPPPELGAEGYLKVRDSLFKSRPRP